MIEVVEAKPWLHKIRSMTNRRKWYEVTQRRDESFFCSCPSFRYNGSTCKHIDIIKILLEK